MFEFLNRFERTDYSRMKELNAHLETINSFLENKNFIFLGIYGCFLYLFRDGFLYAFWIYDDYLKFIKIFKFVRKDIGFYGFEIEKQTYPLDYLKIPDFLKKRFNEEIESLEMTLSEKEKLERASNLFRVPEKNYKIEFPFGITLTITRNQKKPRTYRRVKNVRLIHRVRLPKALKEKRIPLQ